MKNVYSFDSVTDEVRAKHRTDFVDSRDLHPPLPDVSTCAAEIDTPVDIDSDGADWMLLLLVVLFIATMLSIGAGLWNRGGITS